MRVNVTGFRLRPGGWTVGRMVSVAIIITAALLTTFLAIWGSTSFEQFRAWGYLGLFLLGLVSSASLFFPGAFLALVVPAGAVWNPFVVGFVVGLGASLGELVGYWAGSAGQSIGFSPIRRLLKWAERIGGFGVFVGVFIIAIVPGPIFDAAGLFAGAIKMPLQQFLLATFLGKSIRFTVTAAVGFKFVNGL